MLFVYAGTLFVSATLLFAVQPMFGKMVLPLLGGTPAVWNTCMVFYQAVLLTGYLYAHLSIRWLGPRRQAVLHLALMALPWLVLPISVAGWVPEPGANPVPWLLALLTVGVGLPLFVVSASAPMLQAWFADTGHRAAGDPYFLYAASNLGSMLALLSYPFLIEPNFTVQGGLWSQTRLWAGGYALLGVLAVVCAALLWRSRRPTRAHDQARADDDPPDVPNEVPGWGRRLRWIALAFAPSSLMLGVTAHLTTDIAAVPLLWVVPLSLYLLTFVLVFARRKILPHRWMLWMPPLAVAAVAGTFFYGAGGGVAIEVPIHLAAFFLTAMVCHGELARTRPASSHLTEFYIWMSVGGVLGGSFNALVAPQIFTTVLEYPLIIVAACLLRPQPAVKRTGWAWGLDVAVPAAIGAGAAWAALWTDHHWGRATGYAVDAFRRLGFDRIPFGLEPEHIVAAAVLGTTAALVVLLQRWPLRFGLGVAALLVANLVYSNLEIRPLHIQRSFFGVLKVGYDPHLEVYQLYHGSTRHGTQFLDPDKRAIPTTYYNEAGPVGQVLRAVEQRRGERPIEEVGVVGLGTGTLAAYAEPGQRFTFFEIDPAVVDVAANSGYFTYLRDAGGDGEIVLGDARLSVARQPNDKYDLLIIDAFSSDSIPVHLVTREAIALYFEKITEDAVVMVHISNRYLDIGPVIAKIAEDAGVVHRTCRYGPTAEEKAEGASGSHWMALARKPEHLGRLCRDHDWETIQTRPDDPVWTDDFSNIVDVLD